MRNAAAFLDKLRSGRPCFGSVVTTMDPVLVEALGGVMDGLWIDAEHAPLTLESVQSLVMAAQVTRTAAIVRVAWNDPVLVKPVLDLGADGVIFPMVRTADEARRAVAACRYPPAGVRGFGPRRAAQYFQTQSMGEYIRRANETVISLVQIEHPDAVDDIDAILDIEGLTGIVIGSNDLSMAMGYPGEPRHPAVLDAIRSVLDKARDTDKVVGMAIGGDAEIAADWIARGVGWMVMETETSLMLMAAGQVLDGVKGRLADAAPAAAKR